MAAMGMGQATLARQAGVGPAQGPADDDQQSNVSPEDQEAYDEFVTNGMELIYPKEGKGEVSPSIMTSLTATEDPIQNLAMTAASLVSGLIENATNAGHKLDIDVIYQGGAELMENLADICEAAKIHDYSDKEMESALYNAGDQIIKTNPGGIINSDEAKQEFSQIVQADQAGTLEQQVPAISKYNAEQPPADQPEQE